MNASDAQRRLPRIAVTLGDPAGIGPEILVKVLSLPATELSWIPVVVADLRVLQAAAAELGHDLGALAVLPQDGASAAISGPCVIDLHNLAPTEFRRGAVSAAAGRAAGEYIERAVALALEGSVDAVVTNPIHKEAFVLGGYGERYAGHTEMFTALTGAKQSCMMLAGGGLRVCHVTTHVSLSSALSRHITAERILEVIELGHAACLRLGIATPQIGVAGINPHAGSDALFGDEEARLIVPALARARAQGIAADGPIAADTLFCKAKGGMYDLTVAMYHDQGHIPVKLAGFLYDHATGQWDMDGVNVTLGLPIIRTSVDHGTAFDKVGQGIASEKSLLAAIRYAIALAGW